jgi:hypothetical protein
MNQQINPESDLAHPTLQLATGSSDLLMKVCLPESLQSFLQVERFPVAEMGIASELCRQLSEQFSVPVEGPALAVLTAIGPCFGPGARIDLGLGRPITGSLFSVFGAAPGSGLPMVFETVMRPIRGTYLDELQEGPSLRIVDRLDRRSLLHALKSNKTAGLLFTTDNGDMLQTLLEPPDKAIDLDLVERCLNGQPIAVPESQAKWVHVARPNISVCVSSELEEVADFLAQFHRLPRQIRKACIVYQYEGPTGGIAAGMPSSHEDAWGQWLFHLFDFSEEYGELMMELRLVASLEARAVFVEFHNQAAALAANHNKVIREFILDLPGLVARICVALRLLRCRERELIAQVPADTMTAAIAVTKAFVGPQLSALWAAQNREPPEMLDMEAEMMLAKIKVKGGCLSRRALYRTYARQCSSIHDPVLSRLIEKELVSVDPSGVLIVKKK